MIGLRRLARDLNGAAAAEFALVLPVLIMFLLGIIDAGRFLWVYNQAEKATQVGARFAAATKLVPSGLASRKFTVSDGITAGTPVPTSKFASTTCEKPSGSGSCTASGTVTTPGFDDAAFTSIRSRMSQIYPMITDSNLEITYQNVGLGYAGDPYGPDVAPLIRVRLVRMPNFQPILFSLWGGTIPVPGFSASLTMEDGQGSVSN